MAARAVTGYRSQKLPTKPPHISNKFRFQTGTIGPFRCILTWLSQGPPQHCPRAILPLHQMHQHPHHPPQMGITPWFWKPQVGISPLQSLQLWSGMVVCNAVYIYIYIYPLTTAAALPNVTSNCGENRKNMTENAVSPQPFQENELMNWWTVGFRGAPFSSTHQSQSI